MMNDISIMPSSVSVNLCLSSSFEMECRQKKGTANRILASLFFKRWCGKYVVGSVVDSTVMILVHNNYDRALEEFFGFKLCA